MPNIDRAEILPGADLNSPEAIARVYWACPRPGVERFDLAVWPVPPGIDETEIDEDGIEWGIVPSPRLLNGYGGTDTAFELDFVVVKGTEYFARVRARGIPPASNPTMLAEGGWSDTVNVLETPEEEAQNGVLPWPRRLLPGVTTTSLPAEWDATFAGFEQGLAAIGVIPSTYQVTPSSGDIGGGSVGGVSSLAPFLFDPLPLCVYRRETTPGARHEMAQSSPLVNEFWTPNGGGGVMVQNPWVTIRKRAGADPSDPWFIWVRDRHPMAAGSSYQYTVTTFRGDGEVRGSRTTEEFTPAP